MVTGNKEAMVNGVVVQKLLQIKINVESYYLHSTISGQVSIETDCIDNNFGIHS
jgi:hypothetical protein